MKLTSDRTANMQEGNKQVLNWSSFTVLIVEDDLANYKLLESLLKRTNINILHTESGAKAVNICDTCNDINVILMDIQLPEMDGFEAAQKIKEKKPDLPIIILTASIFDGNTIDLKNTCFDGFISKPFDLNHLIETISSFLP
jgi:CheY-like chemotaxis protein